MNISFDDVAGIQVAEKVAEIQRNKKLAARLEADVAREAAELAKGLAPAEVPVRDIGELLGVSFQRAHQLVST